jgi:predicted adenine nucleotide alpha hydrolase (AANH) superfamily ATPase
LKKNNGKVLLHSCCAICSGYSIKHLRELGLEPVSYFYNPNIYPSAEYEKRLEAHKRLCDALDCELIVGDYTPDLYNEAMVGYENHAEGSERCTKCFELRLLKTVQKANELKINKYTTSISISPHKNFDILKEVAKSFSEHYDVEFLPIDFKKQDGFLQSNLIAKSLDLYRQNYCGCQNSMQNVTGKVQIINGKWKMENGKL